MTITGKSIKLRPDVWQIRAQMYGILFSESEGIYWTSPWFPHTLAADKL